MVDYSIILAAGKGTRFYSKLPKVLHPVLGMTMLERAIRAVSPWTEKYIVVVVGFGSELVEDELKKIRSRVSSCEILVSYQEKQLGTGHATRVGTEGLPPDGGSVLIIPGDTPLINSKALEPFLTSEEKAPLSVLSTQVENPFGFGRIIKSSNNLVQKIVEEKDASEDERKVKEVNTSIYRTNLTVLAEYLPKIETGNAQGEYYLTDIAQLLMQEGRDVSAFLTEDALSFSGANTRRELHYLSEKLRASLLDMHMDAGVTIESPATTFIDEEVTLSQDIFIGAGTRLRGSTKISEGVVIEGDSFFRDAIVGENTHCKIGCYIDGAILGSDITVGPFAHIRPGSKLDDGVKIGNFVEVKNSNLAAGVKANHLTYLGDIDIAENTNIGAGTIVCNYDGKNKHRSSIGKNGFVGSNSTLVSPIEIQDDVFVAAGSVVNKDVPEGALAIGRGRQENKPGWARKLKSKN